jgi:hypothetical protein
MRKALLMLISLSIFLLAGGITQSAALEILADATGSDAGFVEDFWGVQFIEGSGYIELATFDITATGGYFDYDGSPFLGAPGVEPILGAMSGLSVGDITYPTAGGAPLGRPETVTFTFAPGSFAAGDWFRFSSDVDGAGGSISSAGGVFGTLGAIFEVSMFSGEVYSVPFQRISTVRSEALIEAAVPEPSSLLLLFSGLLGLIFFRKKFR